MVTLADIAKRAGVSVVSVSKALSGKKGVSAELRNQIQSLAQEMGYRKSAVSPEGKKEPARIGILVADRYMREERSFYWSMIQDITREAMEKDCFCVLEAVGADDEKEGISPGLITGSHADGLIVLGAFSSVYEKSLAEQAEIPLVFVDTRPTVKGFDAVMSDNYTGGRTMTDYLFSQGCRNIAFVGTLLMTPSIDERFFGYTRSLMGNGLRPKEPWIIPDRDPADGVIDPERFIQLPEEMPDAFFCNCDRTASILTKKLKEAGYRVPEDVRVAGYDNFLPDGDEEEAGITTYALDCPGMAARAVHMIRHKIRSAYSYGLVSVSGSFLKRTSA